MFGLLVLDHHFAGPTALPLESRKQVLADQAPTARV